MTTPTREQALTPAELRELCAKLSENEQAMLHRAVHAAHMSGLYLGRDQGLREAKEVCEQRDEEGEGPDCWDWHAKDYAAAIEQLRGK